jgi:Tfp pilus assembly protein PilX
MTTTPPARHDRRDEGFALLTVLVGMSILTVVITVVLTYATQSLRTVSNARDWNQALFAADAGISDYLARLNSDSNYWQTIDCDNVAMKGPDVSGNTCGWNSATPVGWVDVPTTDGAQFHYDVSTTTTAVNGMVELTVTGRDGDETRTVQVRMRRGGFGEFLYYTVYETTDPANTAVYGPSATTIAAACSKYHWTGRSTSTCRDISFITPDQIDGPLHSNDTISMNGNPTFNGTVTTSDPKCKSGVKTDCYTGTGTPRFNKGIGYRAEITLPESIGDLRQHVSPATSATPGCLYTGTTRIKILDPGTTYSTMQVWSPQTIGTLNPGCGTPPLNGQVLSIPNNNIIIVQDVPATQTKDAAGATLATGSCAANYVVPKSGTLNGYPLAGTTTTGDFAATLPESKCKYGNLYVEGTLKGRLTMAADNNIIITGNLTYSGGRTGTDVLGLIAGNSVKIYHPATCTSYSTTTSICSGGTNIDRPLGAGKFNNPTVNAAILTLQHSFGVQQYNLGAPLGDLNLFGTIAQRFRGAVGTSSGGSVATGYVKKYVYDTRLRYSPPPFFLDPVSSSWGVKTYGEQSPRY